MRFLVRRLEAFNRDALPGWRDAEALSWRVLLLGPRLVEFLLMYIVGLCALAAIVALMGIGWLTGLDRKAG